MAPTGTRFVPGRGLQLSQGDTQLSCILLTPARRAGKNIINSVVGQLTVASLGWKLPLPPKTPGAICKQGCDFYFIALENATACRAGWDLGT